MQANEDTEAGKQSQERLQRSDTAMDPGYYCENMGKGGGMRIRDDGGRYRPNTGYCTEVTARPRASLTVNEVHSASEWF